MSTDDKLSPRSAKGSEAGEQASRGALSKFPGWEQLWSYSLWGLPPQGCCLVNWSHLSQCERQEADH